MRGGTEKYTLRQALVSVISSSVTASDFLLSFFVSYRTSFSSSHLIMRGEKASKGKRDKEQTNQSCKE